MRVVYNRFIPLKGFAAVNVFGVVFVRRGSKHAGNAHMLNHEAIHTSQMREMLYVFFYLWYAVEWLVRVVVNWGFIAAYTNIGFEREAKANEKDLSYIGRRRHFAWLRYMTKTVQGKEK